MAVGYRCYMDHMQDGVEIEAAPDFLLHFGTGGIRAKMGSGAARLNLGTVAVVSQGLADWLTADGRVRPVALACDCREHGREFVRRVAEVLGGNGIRTIDLGVAPTPLLSYAVRELQCSAGVVITASHNAREWNGYKVYGPDGCQATTGMCREIASSIAGVRFVRTAEALCEDASSWLADRYVRDLADAAPAGCDGELRVSYSPLNGTGWQLVPRVLERDGVEVCTVPEQSVLDGAFPTCPYPNPEDDAAMSAVATMAQDLGHDLALATDPDSDRLGVYARHEGRMVRLNGDEVGELLLDWCCRVASDAGEDLSQKVAVSTVVSSMALDDICGEWGVQMRRTLTGFKFVGEQLGILEEQGRLDDYLLGVEESLGYLAGSYVRDKDGIQAALLVSRMARWHAAAGRDLVTALSDLYARIGWYRKEQVSVPFADEQAMAELMERLRLTPPTEVAGYKIAKVLDYTSSVAMPGDASQRLPVANVLQWDAENGVRIMIRPSGTEPKIKAYCFVRGDTSGEADSMMGRLVQAVGELLGA